MNKQKLLARTIALNTALVSGVFGQCALAQNASEKGFSSLLEEVVVTARKREENMQDVPVAVSAVNSEQMTALKIRTLTDVYRGMPNTDLQENGTVKGTATYTIRGIGNLSSVPAVDPAVGVFYDGVYLGLNNGLITTTFDMESVQVLRGPQGHLFGKNTTAGAVLMSTKKPKDEFEASIRVAADGSSSGAGGLNQYTMGMVNLPITDTVSARLVGYYNDDEGFADNLFDGSNVGESRTEMARGSIKWQATDTFDLVASFEYQEADGDGSANHTLPVYTHPVTGESQDVTAAGGLIDPVGVIEATCGFTPDFDNNQKICQDYVGYDRRRLKNFNLTMNKDVEFGDGVITSITGWRSLLQGSSIDYDGTSQSWVTVSATTDYEQLTQELRYVGSFDDFNVTAGMHYLSNETLYNESRDVAVMGAELSGGGEHDLESISVYSEVEWMINNLWSATFGLNISRDKKEAEITAVRAVVCDVMDGTCPVDNSDSFTKTNYSPKFGLSYQYSDNTMLYGQLSRAYRSGIYSLRAAEGVPSGPTDVEQTDSLEFGFKSDLGGRGKLNGAIFLNETKDLARIVDSYIPGVGSSTSPLTVGDSRAYGAEFDLTWSLTDNLILLGSLGYLHNEYTDVRVDLVNYEGQAPGTIDSLDKNLTPTISPEWTGKIGLNHSLELGSWGTMDSRITLAYRDSVFEIEDNSMEMPSHKILDAGVDFNSYDGQWTVGVYGKNLLDEALYGGIAPGPLALGARFAPVAAGRIVGAEVTYNF